MHSLITRFKKAWCRSLSTKLRDKIAVTTEPFNLTLIEENSPENHVHGLFHTLEPYVINRPRVFLDGTFEKTSVTIEGRENCAFHDCKFIGCTIRISHQPYNRIEFLRCQFIDCLFEGAVEGRILIKGGTFSHSRFAYNFSVRELRMQGAEGLETCDGLETIVFEHSTSIYHFERDLNSTPLPLTYKFLTWATLRGFGSLPFFGFSYGGAALILFFLSVVDHYNIQVIHLKAGVDSSDTISALESLVDRLNPLSLSWQMPILLLGAVLLMIASTVYAWKCPSRIKEFSLERWTKELGKPASNYVPLTWRNPAWRWVCGFCFLAGSTATVVVLLTRLVEGFAQASRNL